MSAPLILSFNLSDMTTLDRVWPVISNTAILYINQVGPSHPPQRSSDVPQRSSDVQLQQLLAAVADSCCS